MDQWVTESSASQTEVFAIIISTLCSSLIHHWLTTRFPYFFFIGGATILFIAEFVSLCLPVLLIHTCFEDNVILTTVFLVTISFLLCKSARRLYALRTSIFREIKVIILVGTCVIIAAVDCKQIFASHFVKTRTYGFSPMDIGTGLFVSMRAFDVLRRDLHQLNAFDAKKARRRLVETQSTDFKVPRFLPLLLIGLARVLFIEFSGYYQDPIEYGTHWNFFLTLALIEIFIWLFHKMFHHHLVVPFVSFILGIAYFLIISTTDMEEYLTGTDIVRNGFFDSNREGIASTFGYFFIFGLTYLVGYFFVPLVVWDEKYTQHAHESNLLFILSRNAVVQGLIYGAALHYFGLPSRRIANLTYGLHIHTIVTFIIPCMHIYMHRVGDRMEFASLTIQLPTLHSAIYRHGAYFFLAGNLLTGFLNFGRAYIKTPFHEYVSLVVYMFVLCLSTQFIDSLSYSYGERRSK